MLGLDIGQLHSQQVQGWWSGTNKLMLLRGHLSSNDTIVSLFCIDIARRSPFRVLPFLAFSLGVRKDHSARPAGGRAFFYARLNRIQLANNRDTKYKYY